MDMIAYYDAVLLATGVLLAIGIVTATLISIYSLFGASVLAVLLISHALFVKPPVSPGEKEKTSETDRLATE